MALSISNLISLRLLAGILDPVFSLLEYFASIVAVPTPSLRRALRDLVLSSALAAVNHIFAKTLLFSAAGFVDGGGVGYPFSSPAVFSL